MLIRLLGAALRPYGGPVALVVGLMLVQSIANLYLPNLNGGIIMAINENVRLSTLLAVIVPLMLAVVSLLMVVAVPLFQSMQGKIDRITQVLREQITGIRVIRAFIRTADERQRFEAANADL